MKRFSLLGLVWLVVSFNLVAQESAWTDLMTPEVWKKFDDKWIATNEVTLDPANPKKLTAKPVDGGKIWVNGPGRLPDLYTKAEYDDCEVSLDFVVAKGSNAGIKFHGLYEIQILDGKETTGNSFGGIYPRARGSAPYGYLDNGTQPLVNAAKPAGEWNTLTATWMAPRFEKGVKVREGVLLEAVMNGKVIHKNAPVLTPTGANWVRADTPKGPFMIQADHGPLAIRNVKIRAKTAKVPETRPGVVVKGKASEFTLHVPDAIDGAYRGKRFDWAGVIADWKFNGHTLFGPWRTTNPNDADSITGPCEEFGTHSPLGYDEVKPGETFVKIGVGELVKPKEDKYQFMSNYRLVNAGKRDYQVKDGVHHLTHELESTATGYGYKLLKTVASQDTADTAKIMLTATLTNTGKKPITTTVYNHNFFNVDSDMVGPNYEIDFPFDVQAKEPTGRFAELIRINKGQMTFTNKLDKEYIYSELEGFTEKPYTLTLRHKPSKLTMDVVSDQAMSSIRIWGIGSTICPEPFITIRDLAPGKSHTWTTTYTLRKTP
ncbi:MAG: 3-keto-disaccharide hydrolase [Fimbriiglobus sp.]